MLAETLLEVFHGEKDKDFRKTTFKVVGGLGNKQSAIFTIPTRNIEHVKKISQGVIMSEDLSAAHIRYNDPNRPAAVELELAFWYENFDRAQTQLTRRVHWWKENMQ